MYRYILTLVMNGEFLFDFRTNTYEYSPTVPLEAEKTAFLKFDEWAENLREFPSDFVEHLLIKKERIKKMYAGHKRDSPDVVIIQGSPRPDGNCSIFAGWASKTAKSLGKIPAVIYLDDLNIHSCIGCYQCYNYGFCVFRDEMQDIISYVHGASLVVICSPVYTNTVPGGLKICMDRFQAYHAKRTLLHSKNNPKGILLAVAGREGDFNFKCLISVTDSFMANVGIKKSGQILVDNIDEIRDLRNVTGLKAEVEEALRSALDISRL
ncbi:flavodoxin family protein [Methanoplanus sp. FWC-SCC4]|uniref:Flavodoxin family protein n=2 Tax=Methanochimaera problematica TaxID=2609417 RepID=A0AA97FE20_9EURY|nr:flavodoxin family protein [Methanoplanus sp. FWC-SCC4]